MPQINLASGTHGSFVRFAGTADQERYLPYPEGRSLTILRQAVGIIQANIYKKNVHCNSYFKLLPNGRTFDEVWTDNSIWINDDPSLTFSGATSDSNGATSDSNKDITVYEYSFRRGHWWVVGTIVHELAHTNGAGSSPSIAAETALKFCGLSALFDPNAVGVSPQAQKEDGERVA